METIEWGAWAVPATLAGSLFIGSAEHGMLLKKRSGAMRPQNLYASRVPPAQFCTLLYSPPRRTAWS
jgi:hypothetical protein